MSPTVLIIIPAYNEEEAIGNVLDRIMSKTPYRDILVVNDGSLDQTSREANKRGVGMIDLPFNLGIGAAVQAGYMYARDHKYDYVVRVDADGQHDVSQIAELLAPVLAGRADLTIGSRLRGPSGYASTLPRRLGIRILSALVSRIVGRTIEDTTSGFRANNSRVTAAFADHYPDDYPEVESIIWAHKMGFGIEEVGVRMDQRMGGESSITAVRSVYYMAKVILAVTIELLRKTDRRK
ncbi:MAG: glycosyltransferase family 2 protein [bacterium]